eukprot:SAG22_NODE_14391_length_375_cov_2.235507_2_plen_62_part_01
MSRENVFLPINGILKYVENILRIVRRHQNSKRFLISHVITKMSYLNLNLVVVDLNLALIRVW